MLYAVIAAALVACTATAPAAAQTPLPGDLTIEGDRSGSVDLAVAREVPWSQPSPQITIEAGPEQFALALWHVERREFGLRVHVTRKSWGGSQASPMPAGHYRLFLLTQEGATTRVRIKFSGLPGRATVAPVDPVVVRTATVDSWASRYAPSRAVVGDGIASAGPSLGHGRVGATWTGVGFGTGQPCYYGSAPATADAYDRGCRGGTGQEPRFLTSAEETLAGTDLVHDFRWSRADSAFRGYFGYNLHPEVGPLPQLRMTAKWIEFDESAVGD